MTMSTFEPTQAGLQRYTVGEATITRLTAIVFTDFKPTHLLPDWSTQALAPHLGWLVSGCLSPNHAGAAGRLGRPGRRARW